MTITIKPTIADIVKTGDRVNFADGVTVELLSNSKWLGPDQGRYLVSYPNPRHRGRKLRSYCKTAEEAQRVAENVAPLAAQPPVPTAAELKARGIVTKGMRIGYPSEQMYRVERNGISIGSVRRSKKERGKWLAFKDSLNGKSLGTFESVPEAAAALDKAVQVTHAERVQVAVINALKDLGYGVPVSARFLADEYIQAVEGGPCRPWGTPVSTQAVTAALGRLYGNLLVKEYEGERQPDDPKGKLWVAKKALFTSTHVARA